MRQITRTSISKRGSAVLALILLAGIGTFRGPFAESAEELSHVVSELFDSFSLNPFSSLFQSLQKAQYEEANPHRRYLKRNISSSAYFKGKAKKSGVLTLENEPLPPTHDSLQGMFAGDDLKGAKLESFTYDLYFNSVRVYKKNYLDDGFRPTLSHGPSKSLAPAVIKIKLAAWESRAALQELLKEECKNLPEDCLKKLNILTLGELASFPHGKHKGLAGIRALRNRVTGEYRCPEFKSGKMAGYAPMHKVAVVSQTLLKDKLKIDLAKLWLPLEILEQKGKQWAWYQLEFDNPQSILFSYQPESHREIICLPPLMQVEKIGEVGNFCKKDEECLSGCCKEGSCSPHQPSKGLFCEKQVGQSCLSHEYCRYIPEASIWGPKYNGKTCNPMNTLKGREHSLCVHNKCVPDHCRIASITYPKLTKDQCKGDIIPTQLYMCKIGGDSKPELDKKGMMQFHYVKFEE